METKLALVNALILLSLALLARSLTDEEYNCVYTVYVRTGSIPKSGTDSKIDVEMWDQKGAGVRITDLEDWGGLMGSEHDYFERGNLDVFSARGPCLSGPVCAIKLVSDGSGDHHGWYCNYVEVTTTGPHIQCAQKRFAVEQWLAADTYPYELTATRNYCPPTKVLSTPKSISSS